MLGILFLIVVIPILMFGIPELMFRLETRRILSEQKQKNQDQFDSRTYRRCEALKAENNLMRDWEERFDFETDRQIPRLIAGANGFTTFAGYVSASSVRAQEARNKELRENRDLVARA